MYNEYVFSALHTEVWGCPRSFTLNNIKYICVGCFSSCWAETIHNTFTNNDRINHLHQPVNKTQECQECFLDTIKVGLIVTVVAITPLKLSCFLLISTCTSAPEHYRCLTMCISLLCPSLVGEVAQTHWCKMWKHIHITWPAWMS